MRIDSYRPQDATGMSAFRVLDRPPPSGPARPPADDATLLIARADDRPLARLSARLVRGLQDGPEWTGVVGHYEADDDAAGIALLLEATSRLRAEGAELVIGPMDGSTWGRYRLALPTHPDGEPPPFLSEPVNPASYPAQFEAAGFDPVAHYVSRIVDDLDALADRAREVKDRLAAMGHRIEPMNPDRFGATLDGIYDLSLRAFAGNAYYSPIRRDEFMAMYEPMRPMIDPELVLLARDAEDRLVGFVFGFPDLLEAGQGRPSRVVVKSLAVEDAARGAGIGSLLVHEIHRRAARRGYGSAIHALMHVANPSVRISERGGEVYRRYALYGREP
jgi:GNAT superfamily N-acetyltransferase